MNKEELIEAIASGAGLTKADAGRALDGTMDAIEKALKKFKKKIFGLRRAKSVIKILKPPVFLLQPEPVAEFHKENIVRHIGTSPEQVAYIIQEIHFTNTVIIIPRLTPDKIYG